MSNFIQNKIYSKRFIDFHTWLPPTSTKKTYYNKMFHGILFCHDLCTHFEQEKKIIMGLR